MYQPTSLSKFTYDIVITRTRHSMKTSRAWDMKKKWKTNSAQLHQKTQTPQLKKRSSHLKKKVTLLWPKDKSWCYCNRFCPNCTSAPHGSYRIYPSSSSPQGRVITCGCSANLTSIFLVIVLLHYSCTAGCYSSFLLVHFNLRFSNVTPSLIIGKTCVCHAILSLTLLKYVYLLF